MTESATTGGVNLRPIRESDLPVLRTWLDDAQSRHWYGGLESLAQWFAYATSEPRYFSWMACDDDLPVGQITVDVTSEGPAGLGYVVAPSMRMRGYCKRMVTAALARPELRDVVAFEAGIAPDNVGSIRCVTSLGFELTSEVPDEEGMLYFVYRRKR